MPSYSPLHNINQITVLHSTLLNMYCDNKTNKTETQSFCFANKLIETRGIV